MTDTDLKSQLEGLFSDIGPGSEVEPYTPQLEQALAGLLTGEAAAEPAVAELPAAEIPSAFPAKLEEAGEPRARVSSILHSVTTVGGTLLFLLLTVLVWQDPMAWSGFRVLYITGYAVAIFVTLIQWGFGFSLNRALREAEKRLVEATRPQTLLKGRVDELAVANAQLQKTTLQLQTVAQIVQTALSTLDPDELAQQLVRLICERLDLYYVGLFLIDESRQWAVLRAGIGRSGRRMLAQGHKLEVGGNSTVGWCAASAQVHIVPDLDATSRQDPLEASLLLPGTRTEAALPLRSRGRVIGVLDVHSADHEAFSQEDIAILQTMADQIAEAIANAQSFAETQAKLQEMEASQRHAMRERWVDSLSGQGVSSYERIRPGVTPLTDGTTSGDSGELGEAIEQAIARQEVVVQSPSDGTEQAALVAPISLRGETLGALGLHETEGVRQWTDDEIALIETVADQMALAIENARLLEETQQRAERERLIADISAKVRASTDVETILRTAIRELGRSLRASEGLIQLEVGDEAGSPDADKGVMDDDSAHA